MERHREADEDKLTEFQDVPDDCDMPRDWRPQPDTIRAIQESAGEQEQRRDEPARAERVFERMMEKDGKVDLTKPGAWGRFAHASIQDAAEAANPLVEPEKPVTVLKPDGTDGKGRIDIHDEGVREIKRTTSTAFQIGSWIGSLRIRFARYRAINGARISQANRTRPCSSSFRQNVKTDGKR